MTKRVGLLGWPVEHSVSPAMHNAAFAALGLDWSYDLLPVNPNYFLEDVARLLDEGYVGFNVTIPHKQMALKLPQVRERSLATEEIGAANTLSLSAEGGLRATNTDCWGFIEDLQAHGITTDKINCLILGTGGSARAVAFALHASGAAQVIFVSRTPSTQNNMISYDALTIDGRHETCDLIVNCTPVGMSPGVEASPWPESIPFPRTAILYELIYNPPTTRLMMQAQSAGARAIGGLGMLARQGALSFEQWTGIAPPLDVMHEKAKYALSGKHEA